MNLKLSKPLAFFDLETTSIKERVWMRVIIWNFKNFFEKKNQTQRQKDSGIVEIAAWAFEASGLPGPGMPPLPKNYDNLDQNRPDVFHKLVLPDRRMNPQVKVRKIKNFYIQSS